MGQTTFSGPVESQNGFTETPITTAQRDAIASPTAGLLIYNSTTTQYEVYNGSTWVAAFGGGGGGGTYTLNTDYTTGGFVMYNGTGGDAGNEYMRYDTDNITSGTMASTLSALIIGDTITGTYSGGSYSATLTSVFISSGGPTTYTAGISWNGTAPTPGNTNITPDTVVVS